MILDQEEKNILIKLAHGVKEFASNELTYSFSNAILQLIKKDLIKEEKITKEDKNIAVYSLTNTGRTYASSMEGKSAIIKQKPIITCFVVGMDENNNKILFNQRTKEPFFGILGVNGGKMDFGNSPKEAAKREFFEETNLTGDLKLGIIANYHTYNDDELMHHMISFYYYSTTLTGELKEIDREGKNMWLTIDEANSNYEMFPELMDLITTIKENKENNNIAHLNITRKQVNNKFVSYKIEKEL